jgi:hypothetical protein
MKAVEECNCYTVYSTSQRSLYNTSAWGMTTAGPWVLER